MVVGVAAAYPLSRLRIPGRNALLWDAGAAAHAAVGRRHRAALFQRAAQRHCSTSSASCIALTILNLPFTLLLLKNFFDTVPIELEEAAYVEGASLWQIVTQIVMPHVARRHRRGLVLQLHRRLERVPAAADLRAHRDGVPDVGRPLSPPSASRAPIDYGFLAAYSIIYAAPAVGVYFLLRRNLNTGFAGVGVKG